jgi:hypothetical protein
MKFASIMVLLFCTLASTAQAKEYLGFNVCGETSQSKIDEILKNHSAIVESKSDQLGNTTITTRNFKIKDKGYPALIGIYKGKLRAVQIMLAEDLINDIKEKYGKPIRATDQNSSNSNTKAWYFADKENDKVEIDMSVLRFFSNGREVAALTYSCIALTHELEAAISDANAKKSKERPFA